MSQDHFSDPSAVARYTEAPRRFVPGLTLMHQFVEQILAESVSDDGRVLVVGAGGGLELTYLAERHATWWFDGVDPAIAMLRLAQTTMGRLAGRATLHEGYVFDAPAGPFDAATCLLTLHFVPADERLRTLRAIRERLRPGAPLVTFHHSIPDGSARTTWLKRYAAHLVTAGLDSERAMGNVTQIAQALPVLTPEHDETLLREAGFSDIGIYYSALTLRGWVCHA